MATDDARVVGFWCASCGASMPSDTGMCDACRMPNGLTTKLQRKTLDDRRLERAKVCTVCGERFDQSDERTIVRMPKDVHPEWTPRTTLIHERCALPLGDWPARVVA